MKQRRSNLELMRLLAMVLIIAHHFSVHSGFAFQGSPLTGNMLFLQLLSIGGKIGVNLFVMLSSWFLVESRQLNKAKLVMLWGQLVFYSLTIYLLSCLGGLAEFSLWELVRAAVPVLSKQWWFASSYVFLYLLHPLVNRLLAKKWFGGLLLILSVFWFGIPVLAWLPERLRDLAWFLYLYGITGYLRLHRKSSQGTSRRWFCLGLGCFLLTFALSVLGLIARAKSGAVFETVYFDAHHILILLTSVFLFLAFEGLTLPHSSRINALAALSFGMYLIHDSDHLRYPLWRQLLRCADFAGSALLVPYALLCVAGVYLGCAALECLRQRVLRKLTNKG